MLRLLQTLGRGFLRLYPGCVTLGQAIAFNMFLAFFPMLLFALGILSSMELLHGAMHELPARLRMILPPGSEQVVLSYFVRRGLHPWKWISLGLGGMLLAGSQVMIGFMEAFRVLEGARRRPGFLWYQLRAFALLCLTMAPWLAVVVLTVFGRQVRPWLIHHFGLPNLMRDLVFLFYAALVFVLGVGVLVLLYRIGRPGHRQIRDLLPGAAVATILWWSVDGFFGLYVRKMPYEVVYGGLAAAIGLLVWMYLTAMIVLLGAAYNLEADRDHAAS